MGIAKTLYRICEALAEGAGAAREVVGLWRDIEEARAERAARLAPQPTEEEGERRGKKKRKEG